MEEKRKCRGCQEVKVIVSSDAYGEYCEHCDELNWLNDNDFSDY